MLMDKGAPAPAATSGRRRFWLTILFFITLNLIGWVVYHQLFGPHRLDLLRVESFAPGNGATVSLRQALHWKFNLNVQPAQNGAPGTITPAVNGAWSWPDGHTLVFTPAENLQLATQYTLTLAPDRVRTV